MKNAIKFLGIIALAAVIGFTMAACSSGGAGGNSTPTPTPTPTPGADTWTNVTSFSQVNGTWKAPSTVSGKLEGINVTQNFTNYTVTFNSNTKTMTVSGTGTTSFSGGNIAELWDDLTDYIRSSFEDMLDTAVTFNDAAHSYTMTYTDFSQTLTDSDLAETGFQINQNGTKLKVDSGMGEIIYTKQ